MALLLPFVVAFALALPPDYRLLHESDDCVVSISPTRPDGPRHVRAECTWPELDVQQVRDVLTDYPGYPRIVPNIRTATVVRDEGGRVLVHQEHDLPLFADREVRLWMTVRDHDNGGFTITWEKSAEPFDPAPGNAVVKYNDGWWDVGPSADGGVRAIHEIGYDPGVVVPDWLVRRYRTNGVMTVMRNVRSLAGGAAASP